VSEPGNPASSERAIEPTSIDRAFVAVVPPAEVLDALEARVAPLRAGEDRMRWSRRDQRHITLRFLGRVRDVDALTNAAGTAVGTVPGGFSVRLGGSGAFPRAARGTVLWIGVQEGADELTRLAEVVEAAAVGVGFEAEPRAFTPHVTLARAGRPRDLRQLVDALGDAPIGRGWDVDEVVLFASDTRPTGAVHEGIARFRLG
jgi:RNA 2',3'-cyclic 3'-phosphodiesterase